MFFLLLEEMGVRLKERAQVQLLAVAVARQAELAEQDWLALAVAVEAEAELAAVLEVPQLTQI